MKTNGASLLLECHCPGLPGTEDPRIVKAVRAAEKDPGLRGGLERQRAFDRRIMTALGQVMLPPAFLGNLAGAAGSRPARRKGALLQPVVLAIVIGAAVLLGWGAYTLWNRASSFPGKDAAMRMVEVNDDMTGMEMEPKKEPAGALNDWFFNKNFDGYYLPPGFENYQAAGARVFVQDGSPVAQVAIGEHKMVFFSFKADDFGVNLGANDQWHIFTDGDWVAALQQHKDACFMVSFRGSWDDMNGFLQTKK